MSSLQDMLDSRQREGERIHFELGDAWLQGRTAFGGVVAMLGAAAMRDVAGAAWGAEVRLRALQTSFVGPVGAGRLTVAVELLRQGRNVAQVAARIHQGGSITTALLGTFGADRPTTLPTHCPLPPTPRRPAPAATPSTGLREPRPGTPAFLRRFDMHWSDGPPPFSGGSGLRTEFHLRLRGSDALALDAELQTVLLADLPATPLVGHLREPAPNSSVSWALELPRAAPPPGTGWWQMECESLAAAGGYVNHTARMWAPGGALAALCTQVVAVFA